MDTCRPGQQVFDDLYVSFWRNELEGARATQEAKVIAELAALTASATVLDLGAGSGRIAYELARMGISVHAVERSAPMAHEAQRRSQPGYQVVMNDWHSIALTPVFDCVLFWFTTLAAGREPDMKSLRKAREALLPRGTLLIETRHWDRMEREFHSTTRRTSELGVLTETHTYDPVTGRQTTREVYELREQTMERIYEIRRYSFPELREMALEAGFDEVEGFDGRAGPLTNDSQRAILRARA